jgi:Transcription factor WhiB
MVGQFWKTRATLAAQQGPMVCLSTVSGLPRKGLSPHGRAGRSRPNMLDSSAARCSGKDTNLFYENYEEDKNLARKVDSELCLKCPLIAECLVEGVKNKEWGVWGAIYLRDGKINRKFNSHKSTAVWLEIHKRIQENNDVGIPKE